jgi:pyruvate formate lyase activating enzyme
MSGDEKIDASAETWPTQYWHALEDGRIQCDICPRECKLKEGQRGLCFVRGRLNDAVVLTTYGRSSGFCVDPIEKKPLNHFLPGTPTLSFGTAGCNLACNFCQNWDISKSREIDKLTDGAKPEQVARIAQKLGCSSVAFTYNDPVIFMEYAIDIAQACKAIGLATVAVTAGYISPEPRTEFFRHMDAANVDLKAFSEEFYWKITKGHLKDVLETLKYLKAENGTWFELTNLVIPGENDSESEFNDMSAWVVEYLGPEVPMHFTAFHPDYRMKDKPNTPPETLNLARRTALKNGVRHAYIGNVSDRGRASTYCYNCNALLIGRDRYTLTYWGLSKTGACQQCGTPCAGVFDAVPGAWGAKRLPVRMRDFNAEVSPIAPA